MWFEGALCQFCTSCCVVHWTQDPYRIPEQQETVPYAITGSLLCGTVGNAVSERSCWLYVF